MKMTSQARPGSTSAVGPPARLRSRTASVPGRPRQREEVISVTAFV